MRTWTAGALAFLGMAGLAAAQDAEALRRELEALERRKAEILRALEPKAPEATAAHGGAASSAATEPGEALLAEVEVVATGFERARGSSTLPIAVVEGSWYEDRGVSQVADGLRQVPGVAVNRGGAQGAATSLFVRGAASNQVLVLQDGIPLNDPTIGAQFNLFDLDVNNLDRVEVLRGSYGALYGSEAVGGVVNLVSRRGSGPGSFRAGLEAGSFGTHRETVAGWGGDAAFDWSLGVANAGSDGPDDREEFRSRSLAGLFGGRAGADGRWQVAVRSLSSEAEDPFDFGNPLPPDPNISRERDLLAIGATLDKPLAPWLTGRLRISETRIDSMFRNGSDTPGGAIEFKSQSTAGTEQVGGALLADWPRGRDGTLGGSVVLGSDFRVQESVAASDSPFGAGIDLDDTTRNAGAYLLGTVEAGPVTGVLGGRYDRHSQSGGEWSPQAGLGVAIAATGSTLRANYGQGFRAPTPAEFTDPFVGNPDLVAERSESMDAGIEQRLAPGWTASATWFRLRTRDLIAFSGTTFVLENLSRAETEGSEWGLRGDLGGGFSLAGAYTHQRPRDRTTGLPLANRPEDFASLGLSWTRGEWTAGADAYWQGPVPSTGTTGPDADLRVHPGRRAVLDLSVRWQATKCVAAHLRLQNALDEEYVETSTAPRGLPFGIFAGVSVDF